MLSRTYADKPASKIRNRVIVCLFSFCIGLNPVIGIQAQTSTSSEPGIEAGLVILVRGEVIAADSSGTTRPLGRRDAIYVGDTVYTDTEASAQFRMVDGAQISLQPDTEFAIVAYEYEDSPQTDNATLDLVQGGFRTITGNISHENPAAYQARAAGFATIGIRGTAYEVVVTPAGQVLAGVFEGGITISNNSASLDLGIDADFDFGIVPNATTPPQGLVLQPGGLSESAASIANQIAGDQEDEEEEAAGAGQDSATDDTANNAPPANADDNTANNNGNAPTNSSGGTTQTANTTASNNAALAQPSGQEIAVAQVDVTARPVVDGTATSEEVGLDTAALRINPNENGSINGDVFSPGNGNTDNGNSGGDTGNGNPGGDNGNGNSGGDTGNGNSGGDNGNGNSGGDTGNGNSGGDTGNGNSGGDNGNGNSGGDNGNGNSGGDNGNGNSGGDNGNGNSGGDNGNGNSGGDTGNGNSGGDNGNGNSGGDTGNGNSGGDNGNGNSGGDTGNGNSGGDNGNGNSGGDNGNGNGNSGGDNGNGNSGGDNGNGNSGGDNGNGNSGGDNGNGNSGGDNGNGNSGGDNGNGNGNSGGDTGNGNSGGDNGNGNSGGDTGNGNSGGDTGNGNSGGDTGNGNSGGDNGNGNSGGDNGNGNSGGKSGGNNGNGNSGGSSGGGNGSSSNITASNRLSNGDANNGSSSNLRLPESTLEQHAVSWGKWDSPVEENWLVVQEAEDGLIRVATSDYFADINPAAIASMSGSHDYRTGIASTFIGSGSAGDISSLAASMAVNFDSGLISNGQLNVQAADQIWSITFDGMIDQGAVELHAIDGTLYNSSGMLSDQIDAQLGGAFTGSGADAFVGGFELIDELNDFNDVNGLFTIER